MVGKWIISVFECVVVVETLDGKFHSVYDLLGIKILSKSKISRNEGGKKKADNDNSKRKKSTDYKIC